MSPPLRIKLLRIPGCAVLTAPTMFDERGAFVKPFSKDALEEAAFPPFDVAESYYSTSWKNVLRGMHVQVPPKQHAKLVSCVRGVVMDVLLDLRVGSPTEREHEIVALHADNMGVLVAPGVAHGFCVQSSDATLVYYTTSAYSPEHDTGVRWDSARIPWPTSVPIVSSRDAGLPTLAEFKSPFVYEAT